MLVLKINYTKHLAQAAKSVRYHAFRSREEPKDRLGAFDRRSDHANVRSFIESLDDPITKDRKLKNGRTVQYAKMHRLMFSLHRKEFEACGFTSWKPVIREALESFEKQHGIKLDWIAAEHLSAGHPHVHVDIKSVYTALDGTRHRLRFTNQMRLDLRASVERIMERERRERDEERRQQREFHSAIRDITSTLLRGLRDAARADEREAEGLPQQIRKRRQQREHDSDDRGR
ncbi:MAG TPA: hypothetical protein VNT01_03995 [Symbiobacteriaceae bacterium]|nr:hypothetical protein [Symbiobacteriaceae bacterium]